MSVNISDYSIHLRNGIKMDRAYLESQRNQNTDRKMLHLHKDALEISQPAEHRRQIIDRIRHTVMQPSASFSDTRAGILEGIREEKGQYGYSDIVNACGLSYAKLYSEIEKRYENEQESYYHADGTVLTKEDEIEWLDMQFRQETEWQKSCARIAAQGQAFQGNMTEMTAKDTEELEDAFYQAKDAYMKLYHESRQTGGQLILQNFIFGNSRMYEVLDGLGNLQGRVI